MHKDLRFGSELMRCAMQTNGYGPMHNYACQLFLAIIDWIEEYRDALRAIRFLVELTLEPTKLGLAEWLVVGN